MGRTGGTTGEYSHRVAERDWRDGLIWFICLVSFIYVVLFNHTHETNQINH